MRSRKFLPLIIITILILASEFAISKNNFIFSRTLSIAALIIGIVAATSKNKKVKKNELIIMIAVAVAFLLYPLFI